jgi:hypothetical protein
MTGTERVRRYRQKHSTHKPVTKPAAKRGTDHAAGPFEAHIRDLQAALAHERHEQMATRDMYYRLLKGPCRHSDGVQEHPRVSAP